MSELRKVFITDPVTGKIAQVETNGALAVNIQDQHSDAIIAHFNQVHNSTILNGAVAIDARTIEVVSATGFAVGHYAILFDPTSVRFSTFYILAVNGTTITLDTPMDFAYPDGTFVDCAITDMAVNGAVTPQVFGLRGTGAPPGVELSMDVTRLIFTCTTVNSVNLNTFADIARLTNGLVLRARDGRTKNLFNVKDNLELAGLMFDFAVSQSINPQQGQNGFLARLTFAGQNKIGVTIRLDIGQDLEFIVQDDLSAITTFKVIAEGHIVTD